MKGEIIEKLKKKGVVSPTVIEFTNALKRTKEIHEDKSSNPKLVAMAHFFLYSLDFTRWNKQGWRGTMKSEKSELLTRRAMFYLAMKKYSKAISDCDEALKLINNHLKKGYAAPLKIKILAVSGKDEEALNLCANYIKKYHSQKIESKYNQVLTLLLLNRADIYLEQNNYKAAVLDFKAILEKYPQQISKDDQGKIIKAGGCFSFSCYIQPPLGSFDFPKIHEKLKKAKQFLLLE